MKVREAFLDALLVVQVVTSLVLSGLLAYQMTPALPLTSRPRVMPVAPAQTPPAADLLQPMVIWAHTAQGGYGGLTPGSLAYEVAWQQVQDVVTRTLALPELPQPVSTPELTAAESQPAVGVDLPLRLPAADLAALWVERAPAVLKGQLRPEIWPTTVVDRVVISLGEPGGLYLMGPAGALRLSLPFAARTEMAELAAGLTGPEKTPYRLVRSAAGASGAEAGKAGAGTPGGAVTGKTAGEPGVAAGERAGRSGAPEGVPSPRFGPWVLVPDGPQGRSEGVPAVRWSPPGEPRALLPLFFPDYTVVREVEELGGTRIYTDGRRALRVYSSGALEYTESQPRDPAADQAGRLTDALRAALEFAGTRSLWQQDAVLTGLDQSRGRRRLIFSAYRNGLPVVGPRPLMEAIVTGDRVTYLYTAHTLTIGGEDRRVNLVAPEEAVAAAVRFRPPAPTGGSEVPVVHRMCLAYRLEPGTLQSLQPVWVVSFQDGSEALVDAESGQVLP